MLRINCPHKKLTLLYNKLALLLAKNPHRRDLIDIYTRLHDYFPRPYVKLCGRLYGKLYAVVYTQRYNGPRRYLCSYSSKESIVTRKELSGLRLHPDVKKLTLAQSSLAKELQIDTSSVQIDTESIEMTPDEALQLAESMYSELAQRMQETDNEIGL